MPVTIYDLFLHRKGWTKETVPRRFPLSLFFEVGLEPESGCAEPECYKVLGPAAAYISRDGTRCQHHLGDLGFGFVEEADAFIRGAEFEHQAELEREARLTEQEDFDEVAEGEPESRAAFDGNRYLGLKSPHES
jgi:hypothetical protein